MVAFIDDLLCLRDSAKLFQALSSLIPVAVLGGVWYTVDGGRKEGVGRLS